MTVLRVWCSVCSRSLGEIVRHRDSLKWKAAARTNWDKDAEALGIGWFKLGRGWRTHKITIDLPNRRDAGTSAFLAGCSGGHTQQVAVADVLDAVLAGRRDLSL